MDTADLIVFIVMFAVSFGVAIGVRYFLRGRRFVLHESGTRFVLKKDHAPMEESDASASFASEQIEDMVKGKLAAFPDLLGTHFDFRTTSRGTLEIILGDQTYQDIEQIPDERVRRAIAEAVAEFNR